ncbi:MAG: hypothetical protein KKE79_09345 [Actinobacteria bacterium]|nr:hypothetical protein [Actinomycetota bacterium]MCG2795391.1 hypothetical protein [Actinomycetes bacterium]
MSASEEGTGDSPERGREVTRGLIAGIRPDSLEEIFAGDPEFTREVIQAIPDLWKAEYKLVSVFSGYLEGLPTEERTALLCEMLKSFDGVLAGNAANDFSRLVMAVHRESPDLATEIFPGLEAAFSTTDFGKLREAVTALLDYAVAVAEKSIELSTVNPIIIANIVGMLPPLVNSLIKVVSSALKNVDLPSEILASTLFNLLLSVDTAELGSALNSLAGLLKVVHDGNKVLGRDQCMSHAVFLQFADSLLQSLDVSEVSGAIVALCEEAHVMVGATAEILVREPGLLLLLSSTGVSAMNIFHRALATAFNELGKTPEEEMKNIGDEVRERFDTGEVGNMANAVLALTERFRNANPELGRELMLGFAGSVDGELASSAVRDLSADFLEVVRRDPAIGRALEPEEMGRRMNEVLFAFNRTFSDGPLGISRYVSRMLAVVDTHELETAVLNFTQGLTDAVMASTGKGLALLRPLAAVAWRVVVSLGRGLFEKLSGFGSSKCPVP